MSMVSELVLNRRRRFTRLPRACLAACVAVVSAVLPGIAGAACDAACQAAFVLEHNAVRTRVNAGLEPGPAGFQPKPAPPLGALSLSATLAAGAQAWTDACTFGHSGTPGRGENIFASSGVPATPASSVAAWDSESTLYTYGTIPSPNQNDIGHYTQLVWANTTAVGCAITTCSINSPFGGNAPWNFVACQYSPPGNFTGQFPYVLAVVNPPTPGGPLDVDGNGAYDALTDGLIILRYMFGITGSSLIDKALGVGATVTAPAAMLTKLDGLRLQFDIDGNGQVDALSDGLMIMRYLFGLRGNALITGAIVGNPPRATPPAIEAYLLTLRP